MKNKIDIWYYMQGNYRYFLYYRLNKFFIRRHILEQIAWRVHWMDKRCYDRGACIKCGCATTALQMCNKQCDRPCYPPMLSKKIWKQFISSGRLNVNHELFWRMDKETRPILFKITQYEGYVPIN